MKSGPFAPVLFACLSITCRNAARDQPSAQVAAPSQTGSDAHATEADAGHLGQPDGERRRVVVILRHTKRALDSRQSVAEVAAILSGKPEATESAGWWKLNLPLADVTLVVGIDKKTARLEEADFVFPVSLGLRLRDLMTEFGDYRTVHEGKASSVRFVSSLPRNVAVYADLLSSKVSADALVVGVKFWWESN